jgi:multidrug efflux system membrane fusion protein
MRFSATTAGFTTSAVAVTAIGLVLLGASGHGTPNAGAPAPAAAAAMSVPVASVVRQTVPVFLDYIATTEAIRTVTLQAQVTGYLASRGAPDGADVKQGELLYQIDPRDYQAALSQVKAQAQHDAAAYDYSRASQHRNSVLSKDGWVATDTLDQTTSNFHQSEATLAADAAAMQTAELKLGYTEIRAPFAGRLGKSLVHEGALINAAGTQFNTLVELDPIYVTFNPSQTELAAIVKSRSKGPIAADVQTSDDAQERYSGMLSFLDNVVDRSTGTITARATISNPDHTLLPGEFVHVRVHVADQPDALLVPQVALGSSQLGRFVYVIGKDGKAEQRIVSPGASCGSLVVIEKGVKEGDMIIVGNLQKISVGVPVLPEPAKDGDALRRTPPQRS